MYIHMNYNRLYRLSKRTDTVQYSLVIIKLWEEWVVEKGLPTSILGWKMFFEKKNIEPVMTWGHEPSWVTSSSKYHISCEDWVNYLAHDNSFISQLITNSMLFKPYFFLRNSFAIFWKSWQPWLVRQVKGEGGRAEWGQRALPLDCTQSWPMWDIFDTVFGLSVARVENCVKNVEIVERIERKHEKNEVGQGNFFCILKLNQRYIGYFVYLTMIFFS